MRYLATGCLSLLLFAATANAAWLEASSGHFVIYGDQNEKAIRGFAERLELFHAAMTHVFGRQDQRPSPSNRVTIFVVTSQGKVREVVAADNRYLAGIYLPRAGAAIAVVPKLKSTSSNYELSGETVLLHEYAHHFMTGMTARTCPRWFVEGFAEFFAGVKFKADGSIGLGAPPMHRRAGIRTGPRCRSASCSPSTAARVTRSRVTTRSTARAGSCSTTCSSRRSAPGSSRSTRSCLPRATPRCGGRGRLRQPRPAREGHGSVRRAKRLSILVIDRKHLDTGTITVRPLRLGEAEVMPVVMRSKVGVTPEQALKLVPEARRIAAMHPADPAVLTALAEAEFDADFHDAAIAAADRALAIDPNRINAHIQKGYALFAKAQSGASTLESWKEVRGQFVKANKVENDHPIPLVRFYLSYLEQGEPPTRNAVSGLEWALQLAPFDPSLRWLVVQQMIRDERLEEAVQTMAPLAYSPHPGEHTDQARQLLREIEARIGRRPAEGPAEAASASPGAD